VNFICGHRLPLKGSFDVVIDMRRLRDIREQMEDEDDPQADTQNNPPETAQPESLSAPLLS
jgi:hypothetical protein